MLWFKAWLETRWRLGFLAGSILLVWLAPLWTPSTGLSPTVIASRIWMGTHLGTVLLYIFTAIYLAGCGINSQTITPQRQAFMAPCCSRCRFRYHAGGCSLRVLA